MRKRKEKRISLILRPPEMDDPDFLGKSGAIIRDYIRTLYLPANSIAHTAREISQYVSDAGVIEMLELIEKYEYSGSIMDKEGKKQILATIQKLEEQIHYISGT